MLERYEWENILVKKINLPVGKLADLCVPPKEYLINRYRLGDDDKEVFSPDAARLLTKTHPIFTWTRKNICVSGIRTLLIASCVIPNDPIKVAVLPPGTPESEIEKLILADGWLTKLAYSNNSPLANLFSSWRKLSKGLLNELSPALDLTVAELAKTFHVTTPTLYNPRESKK